MKKATVITNAKLNLTLDVLGINGNYHEIKSLVCSVSIGDKVTVRTRKDGRITLTMKGIAVDCSVTDNNAYKTAKAYKEKYDTTGVDVIVEKNIPVGGGLGGSSADVAGVINAMKKLFPIDGDGGDIADQICSDARYMLKGGYAVMSGRGNEVSPLEIEKTLYFIIVTEKEMISTRACYGEFDKQGKTYPAVTEKAVTALKNGDDIEFFRLLKNDLYKPAVNLLEKINENYSVLKSVGAPAVVMTGSGSAVCAVYVDKKQRDADYKKFLPILGKKMIKAQSK